MRACRTGWNISPRFRHTQKDHCLPPVPWYDVITPISLSKKLWFIARVAANAWFSELHIKLDDIMTWVQSLRRHHQTIENQLEINLLIRLIWNSDICHVLIFKIEDCLKLSVSWPNTLWSNRHLKFHCTKLAFFLNFLGQGPDPSTLLNE